MFDLSIFLSVFGLIAGFCLLVYISLFVVKAIGIYGISKKLKFKNPWICFIPVVDNIAIGRIAEKYKKANGKKSAKFSDLLIIFYLFAIVLTAAMAVLFAMGMVNIIEDAKIAVTDGVSMAIEAFTIFIPSVAAFLLAFAAIIAYKILYFVSLWRIYAMLDNDNATLYLVLSVLFSFLTPFFLFFLRNREIAVENEEEADTDAEILEIEY